MGRKNQTTYYLASKELLIYFSATHDYRMSNVNWDSLGRKKGFLNCTGYFFPHGASIDGEILENLAIQASLLFLRKSADMLPSLVVLIQMST